MHKDFIPSVQLTFDTVPSDCARLSKLMTNPQVNSISLDLTKITYCDSAGLALLIEAIRLAKAHSKELKINEIPKRVYSLANFCGIDWIWNNEPTPQIT
jgi:phospholipid transport system transporter-binding protein